MGIELLQHQKDAVDYFTQGAQQFFNNKDGKWQLKGGTGWLLADGPRVSLDCVREPMSVFLIRDDMRALNMLYVRAARHVRR